MADMWDLGRLQAVHAVAVHGSISRAAAALGYTPSAVSQQIAKLERETRVELLERSPGRVALTPAALVLAEAAREVLAVLERAGTRLEQQRDRPFGRFTVAGFPTAVRGLLPAVLGDLAAYPDLECRLLEGDPHRVLESVEAGEADLGVIHDWHNTPLKAPASLIVREIGRDVADLLLPEGHPLAGRDRLEAAELLGERWISQRPGTMCHDWLVRTFDELGAGPDIRFVVEEFQSQAGLVAAGMGVAFAPRLGRGPLPAGVRSAQLAPEPWRTVFAVWRVSADGRPAIEAAVRSMRDRWPVAAGSGGTPT
jgi:DNA-binding transcriptional LysR family regulator